MAASGPTRPPRSSKLTRESSASGLISVIRNLSSSQDNEDRDREKTRLEKEFKRSDQRLDVLIDNHRDALIRAMQDFNKISTRITSARDRVKQVKQKLQTGKILLRCKRDELRRLWLESVEHSHVLQLLEQIEGLNSVPHKLDKFIKVGRYLRATMDLVKSVSLLKGDLADVDALREVKDSLQQQKEQLHETLMDELHKHIYDEVTQECLSKFVKLGRTPKAEKYTQRIPASVDVDELLKMEDSVDKLESEKQAIILVRCLVLLEKIPESVEMIRERCQGHLYNLVSRTTAAVLKGGVGHERLLQLLELIFAQFRTIAGRHELVLTHLKPHVKAESDDEGNSIPLLYTMEDIHSKMQHVLTTLLNCYLGASSVRQENHSGFGAPGSETVDINSYFVRRRPFGNSVNPTKQRKFTLFKFDNSQLAISKSSYLQEQQVVNRDRPDGIGGGAWDHVVCAPTYKNITYMFKPMLHFVEEMEDAQNSPLHSVLVGAVGGFLAMVNEELQAVIEQSAKLLEDFRVITDADTLKSMRVSRPLLHSCVAIDGKIQILRDHAQALPQFAFEFVEKACYVVAQYKEIAETAYRSIVPPQEIRQTNSNLWISDPDICRCLMGLPNWVNLIMDNDHEEMEESPEDIRQRNQQEVGILLSNHGQKKVIPSSEIFSNVHDLKMVAHLHEGLEWLSSRIGEMCEALKVDKGHQADDAKLQEAIKKLKDLATDLQDKANICLLLLHLEVRVHCFYYLLPLVAEGHFVTSGNSVDGQDTDRQVLEFTEDLTKIEEALSTALQIRKHKYVFEGLGQVVAVILMNAVPQIHRINDLGVKRICRDIHAIQQKLTAIAAGREVSLDHARQYFELMLLSANDVLNGIVENGPQFQHLEYRNLLELLCRSRPDEKNKIDSYSNRLKDILSDVPVRI